MEIISTLLVQLGILWRNPQGNLDALECALDELTISGGGLLVVPEMFLTGFTEEIAELAEPIGGPWERSFRALMDRHGLAAILGVVRKHPDQRLHNEALFRCLVRTSSQNGYVPGDAIRAPVHEQLHVLSSRIIRHEHMVPRPVVNTRVTARVGA